MKNGTVILIIVVLICILLWGIGRFITRHKLLKGRIPVDIVETVKLLPGNINSDDASDVIRALGESFGLRAELLDLNDKIEDIKKFDSWVLGSGQEKFERWLRFKGVSKINNNPKTIRDLIMGILPFN